VSFDGTTAVSLEALARDISAASAPSAALDARMLALIAEPMLTIQGATLTAQPFTLNVTYALTARAKRWYMRSLFEIGEPNQPYAACGFEYMPQLGFVQGGTSSTGASIGLACSAAICRTWAEIIRRYVAGSYP
jgi:hypothetical protein